MQITNEKSYLSALKSEKEDLESSLNKEKMLSLQLKQELTEAETRNTDLYKVSSDQFLRVAIKYVLSGCDCYKFIVLSDFRFVLVLEWSESITALDWWKIDYMREITMRSLTLYSFLWPEAPPDEIYCVSLRKSWSENILWEISFPIVYVPVQTFIVYIQENSVSHQVK